MKLDLPQLKDDWTRLYVRIEVLIVIRGSLHDQKVGIGQKTSLLLGEVLELKKEVKELLKEGSKLQKEKAALLEEEMKLVEERRHLDMEKLDSGEESVKLKENANLTERNIKMREQCEIELDTLQPTLAKLEECLVKPEKKLTDLVEKLEKLGQLKKVFTGLIDLYIEVHKSLYRCLFPQNNADKDRSSGNLGFSQIELIHTLEKDFSALRDYHENNICVIRERLHLYNLQTSTMQIVGAMVRQLVQSAELMEIDS